MRERSRFKPGARFRLAAVAWTAAAILFSDPLMLGRPSMVSVNSDMMSATGRYLLQNLEAMRNCPGHKPEAFHGTFGLARKANYQAAIHNDGQIAREDGVSSQLHRFHAHRLAE